MLIKSAKKAKVALPYKGYDLSVDVYAAGVVFGELIFHVSEDDIADLENKIAKGEHFVTRILHMAKLGQVGK
jgi:hypothetical protein